MEIKYRLIIVNFLEYFIWGTWLISAGGYMSDTLGFNGIQIGAVYATMGVVSIFVPTLVGIIADRWVNAERILGVSGLLLAGLFLVLTQVKEFDAFYNVMFLISLLYMPTLALNNALSFFALEKRGYDIVKAFPPIRVWGTIGFIIAAWCVDLWGWKVTEHQFYLSAGASLCLGIYAFTLPPKKPAQIQKQTLLQQFGFDAFVLLRNKNIVIFFLFSILLGAMLQITNIWGVPFLNDFGRTHADSFAVKHSVFLMSISQLSEVIFILIIPFFLKRFGIKKVVLLSMFAWTLRFGFFGVGHPEGLGLLFLILSMVIYGMAFDFFFISGSLFVDEVSEVNNRTSAQGLFMMMTGGFGPIIGGYGSGYIVDVFTENGLKAWPNIWFSFAIYALCIGIMFAVLFTYKHKPK